MDIRAGGKDYDEFVRRAIEEDGVKYIRGRVSRIYEDGRQADGAGRRHPARRAGRDRGRHGGAGHRHAAQDGAEELAQKLHVSYDQYGFLAEAHPKLRPVETNTAGVFLAGACQAPADIPETVAQASGAAAKVAGLFSAATS